MSEVGFEARQSDVKDPTLHHTFEMPQRAQRERYLLLPEPSSG